MAFGHNRETWLRGKELHIPGCNPQGCYPNGQCLPRAWPTHNQRLFHREGGGDGGGVGFLGKKVVADVSLLLTQVVIGWAGMDSQMCPAPSQPREVLATCST